MQRANLSSPTPERMGGPEPHPDVPRLTQVPGQEHIRGTGACVGGSVCICRGGGHQRSRVCAVAGSHVCVGLSVIPALHTQTHGQVFALSRASTCGFVMVKLHGRRQKQMEGEGLSEWRAYPGA